MRELFRALGLRHPKSGQIYRMCSRKGHCANRLVDLGKFEQACIRRAVPELSLVEKATASWPAPCKVYCKPTWLGYMMVQFLGRAVIQESRPPTLSFRASATPCPLRSMTLSALNPQLTRSQVAAAFSHLSKSLAASRKKENRQGFLR